MAQNRGPSPPISIRTTLGSLKTGEVVALESVGRGMYLTIDGVKIARRTFSKGVKAWTPVEPRWMVIDANRPLEIHIKRNGKLLDWAG
jgi:hypothetical protein